MKELLKEKYYVLLYEYLFREIPLINYDNNFLSSKLNYQKVKDENKDEYQKKSILNYFYIRNNLYLENLDAKSELTLEQIDSETEYETKKKFVEETLKEILFDPKTNKEYGVSLGPVSNDYIVKNGTLVIGFRYDEYYDYDDNDDSWSDKYDARSDEIYEILPKIEQEISEKIKIPTKVIQYTDGSVLLENGMTM